MSTEQFLGSILIVDDDALSRDVLCQYLTRTGYTTCSVDNGEQAIVLATMQPFDLVMLDVTMPDVDGFTVLQRLRQLYTVTELPIIMVTGKTDSANIVQALQLGANDYVTKPLDLPVVLARIHSHITRKNTEDALRRSEERYALAIQGANDGVWDWDVCRGEMYFSPRWKAMLGYAEDEIGTQPEEWFTRVHPDDLDTLQARLADHLKGLTPHFEYEHRMLHKNGNYHWMLGRGLAVGRPTGEVSRMAGSLTDITESKVSDPLTGLPNRLLFLDRLGRATERAKRRRDYLFAVLFIDLNRFKMINDSFGHSVGDELLAIIAHRLEVCLRASDTVARLIGEHTVARFGGDEFAILLEDIQHVSDATRIADRIHRELSLPCTLNGQEFFPTTSIGIALSATGYEHAEDILRDAGIALHRTKLDGHVPYEVFDQTMHASTVARLQLETDLRHAIDQGELQVHYQPLVSLSFGRIIGFEALARWCHPHRGFISPVEFIPIAEKTRLIIPIGTWVLRQACQQTRTWQKQLPSHPFLLVSVNLSGVQFVQPDLVELIDSVLKEADLEPHSVKLEITESVLMDNVDSATSMLTRLHTLGVKLGLDDFGTGYSSLSCLHRYPFNVLKIDKSFIQRLGTDDESAEIVRTIIALAHNLRLEVIAEGVETPQQLAYLKTLGCEYGQGYLFSQPVDAETATALLSASLQW
jgi:diguanylate cyclase (GGDEF)-like protein/PAS domain S-box-containing protein